MADVPIALMNPPEGYIEWIAEAKVRSRTDTAVVQQVAAQRWWGHYLKLLDKLRQADERVAYANAAVEHGWSTSVLDTYIETRSVERTGKAITNFNHTLPPARTDLARAARNGPYKLGVLGPGADVEERAIDKSLVDHLAINGEVKRDVDGPKVGRLLCKTKDEVVAEYALRNISAPFGVSEKTLVKSLPEPPVANLPTIEQIEGEGEGL